MIRNLAALMILLAAAGCHHDPLTGDWDLYAASTPGRSGTISFSGGKFKEHFDSSVATLGLAVDMSGTYSMQGSVLRLEPNAMGVTTGDTAKSSPTNPPASPSASLDYQITWEGADLAYLTFMEGSTKSVMAIARNGARPDASRVQISTSSGASSKETAKTAEPAAEPNQTPSSPAAAQPASPAPPEAETAPAPPEEAPAKATEAPPRQTAGNGWGEPAPSRPQPQEPAQGSSTEGQ